MTLKILVGSFANCLARNLNAFADSYSSFLLKSMLRLSSSWSADRLLEKKTLSLPRRRRRPGRVVLCAAAASSSSPPLSLPTHLGRPIVFPFFPVSSLVVRIRALSLTSSAPDRQEKNTSSSGYAAGPQGRSGERTYRLLSQA